MLVVKLEVWPHGEETAAREIGRATIGNVGGTEETGEYEWRLAEDGDVRAAGKVASFPRRRLRAWDLLAAILRQVSPAELATVQPAAPEPRCLLCRAEGPLWNTIGGRLCAACMVKPVGCDR